MNKDPSIAFIVDDENALLETRRLVEKALKYGRITRSGELLIEDFGLSKTNILKLALVLRFLAHRIDENISDTLSPKELVTVLSERYESVGSRLSKLAGAGFVEKVGHGKYRAKLFQVKRFLLGLEGQEVEGVANAVRRKRRRIIPDSDKSKRGGVYLAVQKLIEKEYFKTPRFVSEAKKELEVEGDFFDIRRVDTAVRVMHKKSLRRLRSEKGGKAKWQYVNR